MSKKALKGLRAMRLWPVTKNSSTEYTTGTKVDLVGAQQMTREISRNEYTIYADDGVYDAGSDFQYEDLTVTLAELPLSVEAALSGGTYDSGTDTYTFKTTDIAPEYALGYAAMKLDGGFRMFKHYVGKLMSVKVDHQSKGDSNDIQAYQLTFRSSARQCDDKIRETQDSTTADYTWLDTVDQYPVVPEG